MYMTTGVEISIINVCILIHEQCFDFFKKFVRDIVYWYILIRFWMELFVSKGLLPVEPAYSLFLVLKILVKKWKNI